MAPRCVSKRAADQHVLFITDGQPTSGERAVGEQIARAQALGVAVHTIFIGNAACPPILDELSVTTGGERFTAYFDVETRAIEVVDRSSVGTYGDAQAATWLGRRASSPEAREEQRRLDRNARVPALFKHYLSTNYADARDLA